MFRFTIRDVLWLTVVVAMGFGWWPELKNRGPENMKLRDENVRLVQERDAVRHQLDSKLVETMYDIRTEREVWNRTMEIERRKLKAEVDRLRATTLPANDSN